MNLKICLFALGLLSVSAIAEVPVENVISEINPSEMPLVQEEAKGDEALNQLKNLPQTKPVENVIPEINPSEMPLVQEEAKGDEALNQLKNLPQTEPVENVIPEINPSEEQKEVKQNRFLIMISSYKRPLLLSGQILRFMNQTYKNFFVTVSVKGTEEENIRSTFMQEWEPFIQEKRLLVRFNKNGEQLSNLLDAARDLPLDEYDYFCKVDDDDWYTPHYLEDVNNWLNKEKDVDLTFTTNMLILENGKESTKMYRSPLDWNGQTICMSRKILDALFTLEKDPGAYNDVLPKSKVNYLKTRFEDNLIHRLTEALGGVLQFRKTPVTDLIYGKQYPSITNPN